MSTLKQQQSTNVAKGKEILAKYRKDKEELEQVYRHELVELDEFPLLLYKPKRGQSQESCERGQARLDRKAMTSLARLKEDAMIVFEGDLYEVEKTRDDYLDILEVESIREEGIEKSNFKKLIMTGFKFSYSRRKMVSHSNEYQREAQLQNIIATVAFKGPKYDVGIPYREDLHFRLKVATVFAAGNDENEEELAEIYEAREAVLHLRRLESAARASLIQRGMIERKYDDSSDDEDNSDDMDDSDN